MTQHELEQMAEALMAWGDAPDAFYAGPASQPLAGCERGYRGASMKKWPTPVGEPVEFLSRTSASALTV